MRLEPGDTLRILDPSRVANLRSVDRVVIVGSSCCGKTTLVAAIRRSDLVREGRVQVPRRYVTRARRRDDCTLENVHVSEEEFDALVARGEIDLHWKRQLDATVRYGFERARPGALPVYSANNAILDREADLRPRSALAGALLVGILAPEEVRERRLRARSPELVAAHPREVTRRLADAARTVLPHVHVVVENHGDREAAAKVEVVALVRSILARTS